MDKLKQIQDKIAEIQAKSAVAPELKAFATLFLKVLAEAKSDFSNISKENQAKIDQAFAYLEQEHEKLENNVLQLTEKAKTDFNIALESVKSLVAELKSIEYTNGKDGENGADADEEKIIEEVLAKIPKQEEETGETIADKLESLKGDSRLDASAIKNLPEFKESKANGGGWRNLYQMHDVELDSPTDNQVLTYDGTTNTWKNETASGGGHTIEEEGTPLTQRTKLNFVGANVTVTDDAGDDATVVTISGGGTIDGSGSAGTLAFWSDADTLTYDAHLTYDSVNDVLHTHKIAGDATDGLILESANGTDIGILGAANTANVTWYGSHNYDTATQDTIAAFTGAGKTLGSLSTTTYPSLTELSYVKGLTSSAQTQITARLKLDQTTPQHIINGQPYFDDGIILDNTPTVGSFVEGKMYYDTTKKTISAQIATDVTLQLGQEEVSLCYNNTGSDMFNGQVVYASGASGDMPTIALAKADSLATSQNIFGILTQNIPNGTSGLVTRRGIVHDLDTSGMAAGVPVYLSDTVAGAFMDTPPTDINNFTIQVGGTLLIDPTTGSVFVNIEDVVNLNSLSDVDISSPAVDEVLRYNGSIWVNGPGATVGAGPGIEFFNSTPNLIAANTQNLFAMNSLSKTPIVTAEQTISGTATNNTVGFAAWLYDTALGRTTIDAGIWDFDTYASVNTTAAGRVTTLTRQIYAAKPFATGTVTITGSGTSRTATASAGTPFAVASIDASATNTTASYLQTPNGLFQITARTSDTVVTIETLTTYTNETAVAGTVWKKLFGSTSNTITATGTNYSLNSFSTSQGAFTIDVTTKLGAISFVTSNNTTTLTLTYNGTARNTHFATPLTTLHNDLAGLQGGTSNEYYHLTSAQSTIVGNTSGTNTGDQTITNSSDATSHTVTLSASGGSVQLIEGSNITLTTGGTGSAGTVTIAASGGGLAWGNSISGTTADGVTLTLSNTSDDGASALKLIAGNTQANQSALANLQLGTSGQVQGLLIQGTGSGTLGAIGTGVNHLTLWGDTASNNNIVFAVGNEVAFTEHFNIRAHGGMTSDWGTIPANPSFGYGWNITVGDAGANNRSGIRQTWGNTQTNTGGMANLTNVGTSAKVTAFLARGIFGSVTGEYLTSGGGFYAHGETANQNTRAFAAGNETSPTTRWSVSTAGQTVQNLAIATVSANNVTLPNSVTSAKAGYEVTLGNTQANNPYGFLANVGTSAKITGVMVKGTFGTATTGLTSAFTAWGNTAAQSTRALAIGNGVAFTETAFINTDGKATVVDLTTTGNIELGHASDTTIARVSAGVIAVEGVNVLTTAGGTLTGNITLGENTSIALDPAGSADGKYSGITITGTGGATIAFGELVYLSSVDSRWELADADAATTADRMLGIAVTSSTDGAAITVLLMGNIRADSKFPALTIGSPVYVGETPGAVQTAIPTGADAVIRRVGYALTADELYFNPSMDSQITVA